MTPEVSEMISKHKLTQPVIHDDLDATRCVCRSVVVARPQSTGNACADCGGMTVQTGTCHTCTSCGTSGGCG